MTDRSTAAFAGPSPRPPGRERAAAVLCWVGAWLVAAAWLAASGYGSRDPDSTLYAGISARLVQEPFSGWIAPEWWGLWNLHGLYQEHPVGLFVAAGALGRLGYPPLQAAYAMNGVYQVASFVLVGLIAATVVSRRDARVLATVLQLLPIAFVFRVRANHEYALLAGFLLAIYATERARASLWWTPVMVGAFCWVVLVKGVFAFMVPAACALWLIARTGSSDGPRTMWPAWVGVAAMVPAALALARGYEAFYQSATGTSFLGAYQARQLPTEALTGELPLARTAYSLVWYLGRVAWFSFPWSLVALWALAAAWRRESWRAVVPRRVSDPIDRGHAPDAPWRATEGARRGAWFALVTAGAIVLAFSLAHRKAERYIFPAYFLVGAVGASVAARHPRAAALLARLDRPWIPAAAWLTLFALRMVTSGKLPEFTFWRT